MAIMHTRSGDLAKGSKRMKIYSKVRLVASEKKDLSELSDSSLIRIASDENDERHKKAQLLLKKRLNTADSENTEEESEEDEKALDLMKSPKQQPVKKDSTFMEDLAELYKQEVSNWDSVKNRSN